MDSDQQGSWERVSAELRAYRELQHQAWGDIDNATLGRYLAGEVSAQERQQVEQALDELPELRKLTELVQDVLGECSPVAESAPPILRFPETKRPQPRRGQAPRWRQRMILVAAACLLLALGLKMPRLSPFAPAPSEPRTNPEASFAMRMPDPGHEDFVLFPTAAEGKDNPVAASPSMHGSAALVPASGSFVMARKPGPLTEDDRRRNLRQARALREQADYYRSCGDIARAAPTLSKAVALLGNTVGPQDERTQQSLVSLAQVYTVALNSPAPTFPDRLESDMRITEMKEPAAPSRPLLLAPGLRSGGMGAPRTSRPLVKRDREAANAIELRERITCQRPRLLKQAVTPVLALAYRQAKTPRERVDYARALGNLGPAARDAVPLLTDRLRTRCPKEERQAILAALGTMGPGARSAIPELLKTIQTAPSDEARQEAARTLVSLGPCARCVVEECRRAQTPANPALRQALDALAGRAGRIGILDDGECFSVRVLRQSNHLIHRLAREANVEVYVQTEPRCTEAECKQCCDRLCEMGAAGVCILVQRETGRARVVVSDSLRQKGIDAKELERVLEQRFLKKEYDAGLLEGMRLVARHTIRPTRR